MQGQAGKGKSQGRKGVNTHRLNSSVHVESAWIESPVWDTSRYSSLSPPSWAGWGGSAQGWWCFRRLSQPWCDRDRTIFEWNTHTARAARSAFWKTGLFILLPESYLLGFCATHPAPGCAWLRGTGTSFMGFPKSSPSLPVPTLNGLWTRLLHSAAIIHHLEKVSFCLIRMSVVYRLALKILMVVFPSDNNRTIYFHLLHLL